MSTVEEEIQHLRELERSIVSNLQNVNHLLEIKKALLNEEKRKDVRIAAVHCLRRIFTELSDHETIQKGKKDHYLAVNQSSTSKKLKNNSIKIYEWFLQQYQDLQSIFSTLLSNTATSWSHALVIRTYLELLKIDHKVYENTFPLEHIVPDTNFALSSFRQLIITLISIPFELDVDLLIMLKDEVFNYLDCLYFGFYVLQDILTEFKELATELQVEKQLLFPNNDQSSTARKLTKEQFSFLEKEQQFQRKKKNLLDVIRMMPISPELIGSTENAPSDEAGKYWIPFENVATTPADAGNDDSDSDAEMDEEKKFIEEEQMTAAKQKKKALLLGKRKFTATNNSTTSNTTSTTTTTTKRKKTFPQQLSDYLSYQKLFSKNWILLLSLPWSIKEHKVLLQHLSSTILKQLSNPLLLADYLTECYQFGGIIAILALENLLILITQYNLDYPHFFLSLYQLCNHFIFQSKYVHKYLQLLSFCFQSSNIPEVMIVSFLKRLSYIAIHCTSNKGIYCIHQMIWLLKQYKSSQQLIHRKISNKKKKESKGLAKEVEGDEEREEKQANEEEEEEGKKKKKQKKSHGAATDGQLPAREEFHLEEEKDLLANHAAESSLYELELLENHYLYASIAAVTSTLRNAETTSIHAIPINMKEYTNISLQSLIEKEFEEMKKTHYKDCALAFKKPTQLFSL